MVLLISMELLMWKECLVGFDGERNQILAAAAAAAVKQEAEEG